MVWEILLYELYICGVFNDIILVELVLYSIKLQDYHPVYSTLGVSEWVTVSCEVWAEAEETVWYWAYNTQVAALKMYEINICFM